MNRQQVRRTKRRWDDIPCFSDCTVKVDIEELPNTAVDVFIKISEDLLLQYNLDMFKRWRLYPIVVVDGFFFRDSFIFIGVASDEWMEDYFSDELFERLDGYA
ncbi:MAG: hypothetical protein QW445_01690 [Candidatus Bathyarchaeia archaeon]